MRSMSRTVVLALALVLASCGGRASMPGSDQAAGPTWLEVDNRANLDMNVFVIREGGERVRLGTATAHLTTRMEIPERLMFSLTSLRFQADPVGGSRAPVSENITVAPGDTVVLQIPPL